MIKGAPGRLMWAGGANKALVLALMMAVATALVASALVLSVARPAEAAFPGKNGKIAYQRAFDSWAKHPNFSSPETLLIDDGEDPSYSPDGSRVAFMSDNEIYLTNADGTGTPRRLTNNCLLDGQPAWSHDGTRITFLKRGDGEQDGNPCDGYLNIWTMNADGTDQRQLTTGGVSGAPAWSVPLDGAPDGKIAFSHGGKIWTMLPNGTGLTQVFYTCPTDNGGVCDNAVGSPIFSPDGSEMTAEYYGDIFIIPSGGGVSRLLLGTPEEGYPGQEGGPVWSPDGTKIAFEHNGNVGGSHYGLYWAKADGSSTEAKQLTVKKGEGDADWQPLPQCTRTVNDNNDPLLGTASKDVLCGDARANTIKGLGGNDIILGQGGSDQITGNLGNDTLNGGPGNDTALYSGSTPVIANLTTEFAKGAGLDVLLGVENLSGSSAEDRLTGSEVANKLIGGAGADKMFALAGNDTLNSKDGVNGNDTLSGGAGTDTKITDTTERSIVGVP